MERRRNQLSTWLSPSRVFVDLLNSLGRFILFPNIKKKKNTKINIYNYFLFVHKNNLFFSLYSRILFTYLLEI